MAGTNEGTPPLRRVAAVLVGLEALTLVAVGAWVGIGALAGDAGGAMSAALAFMALLAGVVLGWACRALWRGAAWPRGLALTWQVLQCAAGATVIEWSIVAGAVAIAVAVAAGAALFSDARRDAPPAGGEATAAQSER